LDSEASYYPVSEGYTGPCMLVEAILEISHGVKFDMVLDKFRLKQKGKTVKIVDKRKATERVNREELTLKSSVQI
jgi:hypothetical protein